MPSLDDVRRLALALPDTGEKVSWGSVMWTVHGKGFVWERPLRTSDVAALERLGREIPEGEILGVRVAGEAAAQRDRDRGGRPLGRDVEREPGLALRSATEPPEVVHPEEAAHEVAEERGVPEPHARPVRGSEEPVPRAREDVQRGGARGAGVAGDDDRARREVPPSTLHGRARTLLVAPHGRWWSQR